MTDGLRLRRHLYEQLSRTRLASKRRRMLRRQIALLGGPADGSGGGAAGVREPRPLGPGGAPSRGAVASA